MYTHVCVDDDISTNASQNMRCVFINKNVQNSRNKIRQLVASKKKYTNLHF